MLITQSVLQPWVMNLPLRAQGTLLTGIRGCDLAPKDPTTIDETYGCSTGESNPARALTAFLRFCVLVPADPREVGIPGAWLQRTPPCNWKPSQLGHYPQHWYAHIMHGFEVIGYLHPTEELRMAAFHVYSRLVRNLHLAVETRHDMLERLTEDRLANDTVVS